MFIGLMEKARNRDEGFTLIELLVVVIIIGILAAIAIPTFLNQRESAWRSAVESDLRNAATDMQTYYTENGEYHADGVNGTEYGTDWTATADGSEGVTVTVQQPGGTDPNRQKFCLSGTHEQLDGTVAVYDSDEGGLNTGGTC